MAKQARPARPLRPDDSIGRLLRRIEAGDEEAFGLLFRRSSEVVVATFRNWYGRGRRSVCDEDDLAQLLFLDLWDNIRTGKLVEIHVGEDFWRYLFGAAAHRIFRQRKYDARQKRDPRVLAPSDVLLAVPSSVPAPEAEAAFTDELFRLMRLLPSLEDRCIAHLRLHGCSNNSICVQLRMSPSTVDRRISLIKEIWEAELKRLGEWPLL